MSTVNEVSGQSWGDKQFTPMDHHRTTQLPPPLTTPQIPPHQHIGSNQNTLRPQPSAPNSSPPKQLLSKSPLAPLRAKTGNARPPTRVPGWLGDREFTASKSQVCGGSTPALGPIMPGAVAVSTVSSGTSGNGRFDAAITNIRPLRDTRKMPPSKAVGLVEVQGVGSEGVLGVDNLDISRGLVEASGTTTATTLNSGNREETPASNLQPTPNPPVTGKPTVDKQSQTSPTNPDVLSNTPAPPEPIQVPAATITKPAYEPNNEYIIPGVFDPYKYGHPGVPSSLPPKNTRTDTESQISRVPPGATTTLQPRTIIITNLPAHPTLTMISTICKGAGPLETITLFSTLKKARVSFVHSTDAKRYFKKTSNGSVFTYKSPDNKIVTHTSFVDMKPDINFLSSATRYLVTHKHATRTVLIVGWDRGNLKYLVGAEEEEMTYEALLLQLARVYSYTSLDNRIEGVKWRRNSEGALEGLLIYSRIKDAYCALAAMLLEEELRTCKISYGKDPCAP